MLANDIRNDTPDWRDLRDDTVQPDALTARSVANASPAPSIGGRKAKSASWANDSSIDLLDLENKSSGRRKGGDVVHVAADGGAPGDRNLAVGSVRIGHRRQSEH
ncbi:MAG: hypothetical protein Q8O67_25855 [Deltaproteobacteria bacterium]|nr:hypothetical protein [Deltaproteobacteria bacterium]